MKGEPIAFLLVEDSEHDILAFERAWKENGISNELRIVRDGHECLDYLNRRGRYRHAEDAPTPAVILLNDHLPELDGHQVLEAIRQDSRTAYIPVIMFSASESDRKKARRYDSGANAYLTKPLKYEDLSRTVHRLSRFWELVEAPETTSR
jgi:two-component system response regulator